MAALVSCASPLTSDDVIHACAALYACNSTGAERGCQGLPAETLRCVVDAHADCVAVNACVAVKLESGPCPAALSGCTSEGVAMCLLNGQIAVTNCEPQTSCVSSPISNTAGCGVGSCTTNTVPTCQGSVVSSCLGGIMRYHDCARDGLVCGIDAYGQGACLGPGPACTTSTCNGTQAQICEGGHRLDTDIDCRDGFTDRICAGQYGCTLPAAQTATFDECACQCEASHCACWDGACNGTQLTFCVGGSGYGNFKATVDCASLGFRTCGVNPYHGGYSTPPCGHASAYTCIN